MDVLKKSDQQEKFSYEKLAFSIGAANADTGEALDIELLLAEFQNIVADKEFITSGQIYVIVCGQLYAKGALNTLKKYSEYKEIIRDP